MDVAAFIIAIFALVFALIGMGLAMRALYILGVNAGLHKQFEEKPAPTPPVVKIDKEFKKPLRVQGDKIIYNDDPLIYVIDDFISYSSGIIIRMLL